MIKFGFPFDKYKTLNDYFKHKSDIKIIIGPKGSGKTTASLAVMVYQMLTAPVWNNIVLDKKQAKYLKSNNVRKTRMVVIMKQREVLEDNIIPAMRRFFYDNPTLFRKIKGAPSLVYEITIPLLEDGTSVLCEVNFKSIQSDDKESILSKLRGYDCNFILIDEATTIDEDIIFEAIDRAGRYSNPASNDTANIPMLVLMTSNGACRKVEQGAKKGQDRLLYKLAKHQLNSELENPFKETLIFKEKKRLASLRGIDERDINKILEIKISPEDEKRIVENKVKLFFQPPALLKVSNPSGGKPFYVNNPDAENIDNLRGGYDYYYMMTNGSESSIKASVMGEFYDNEAGELVFDTFSRLLHVRDRDTLLSGAKNFNYFLSFDCGSTPVALMAFINKLGHVCVLEEFYSLKRTAMEEFYSRCVEPVLNAKYNGCTPIEVYIDPAGFVKGQAQYVSPVDVLRKKGLIARQKWKCNRLDFRLSITNEYLNNILYKNSSKLLINNECKYLINALEHDYIFEAKRYSINEFHEEPTKTHVNYASDLADALQYMCIGLKFSNYNQNNINKCLEKYISFDENCKNKEYVWLG